MKLLTITISVILLSGCIKTSSYSTQWYVKNESGKDVTIAFPLPELRPDKSNKIEPGDSLYLWGKHESSIPYHNIKKTTPSWDELLKVRLPMSDRYEPIFLRIMFEENTENGKLILYKEWTPDNPDTEHDFFNERDWDRYDSGRLYEGESIITPLHTWVFSILPEDLENARIE